MMNQSKSYMLNSVLYAAKEQGIFETIGRAKSLEFVSSVVKIGVAYDCNEHEILDSIGEHLGICSCCLEESYDMKDGICSACINEHRV